MWPIETQRLRFVCSATRRAPSSTFSKSRLDRPWPWVTMQKRCAPAASAARACSRICSGSIIACIGVSASAYFDWAQKPQSSAQPPDLALTSEHMSVESPKRSTRASQARSTSASISAWSSSSPRRSASSRVISGGIGAGTIWRATPDGRDLAALSDPATPRRALLGERAHALAEVLGGEAGAAQLDQLLLDLGVERRLRVEHRADHALVAAAAPAARWRRSRRPARPPPRPGGSRSATRVDQTPARAPCGRRSGGRPGTARACAARRSRR